MVKNDIAERIHLRMGLPKKDSAELLETALQLIKHTLESGEDVKISGFGKFSLKTKRPRRGRNPQTGESLVLAGRRILSFKASHVLKESVNKAAARQNNVE